MQRVFVIALVTCSVLLGACNLFKTRYEEIPPDFPKTISPLGTVDYTWRIRSLDGRELTLSQFQGKKLFINIWGTWCSPCLVELPHLQELYDSMRSDPDIAFLFVSDEPDSTLKLFVSRNDYSLPFYVCDKSKPEVFDDQAYPTTFIANSRGEIVYKKEGVAKWDHPSVMKFLQDL
jgi:thiol-disulfide isomerase/thioredoxin